MAQSSQKYEIFDRVIGMGLEVVPEFSKDYGYGELCIWPVNYTQRINHVFSTLILLWK